MINYNDTKTQISVNLPVWENMSETEKTDVFNKAKEINCTHYLEIKRHGVVYFVSNQGAQNMASNGFLPKAIN